MSDAKKQRQLDKLSEGAISIISRVTRVEDASLPHRDLLSDMGAPALTVDLLNCNNSLPGHSIRRYALYFDGALYETSTIVYNSKPLTDEEFNSYKQAAIEFQKENLRLGQSIVTIVQEDGSFILAVDYDRGTVVEGRFHNKTRVIALSLVSIPSYVDGLSEDNDIGVRDILMSRCQDTYWYKEYEDFKKFSTDVSLFDSNGLTTHNTLWTICSKDNENATPELIHAFRCNTGSSSRVHYLNLRGKTLRFTGSLKHVEMADHIISDKNISPTSVEVLSLHRHKVNFDMRGATATEVDEIAEHISVMPTVLGDLFIDRAEIHQLGYLLTNDCIQSSVKRSSFTANFYITSNIEDALYGDFSANFNSSIMYNRANEPALALIGEGGHVDVTLEEFKEIGLEEKCRKAREDKEYEKEFNRELREYFESKLKYLV